MFPFPPISMLEFQVKIQYKAWNDAYTHSPILERVQGHFCLIYFADDCSKAKSMQMLPSSDVRKKSHIANLRIYVKQGISRMKVFHILKDELPINLIPLADCIVCVCVALCNLPPPLCE